MFCAQCGKDIGDNTGLCPECSQKAVSSAPAPAAPASAMADQDSEYFEGWSDRTVRILLFVNAFLPIVGIIAGIIGLFKPYNKYQGLTLIFEGIYVGAMYALISPIGGLICGLLMAALLSFAPRRKCPDCDLVLPRFRKPANTKQALWGGWTCPRCGCEVDRKGRKIAKETNISA